MKSPCKCSPNKNCGKDSNESSKSKPKKMQTALGLLDKDIHFKYYVLKSVFVSRKKITIFVCAFDEKMGNLLGLSFCHKMSDFSPIRPIKNMNTLLMILKQTIYFFAMRLFAIIVIFKLHQIAFLECNLV
jgi:hypothetical protein